MTTIAYRDGVLAADSKAYGGLYKNSPGQKAKIHRIANGALQGWLVGISTNNVGGDKLLLAWLDAGAPLPTNESLKPDQFVILALSPAGELFLANDNLSLSGPITSDFYAIGSGDDFAMGAMAMGASAERAVRVAMQFDAHTGGEVAALWLHDSCCAVHNEPAYPAGPCDCQAALSAIVARSGVGAG